MAERLSYVVLDVFTERPLEGNPVAVFPDAGCLGGELMQALARELNLSETVFVTTAAARTAEAAVRIFTPRVELPFAGHPVLGAAILLGERLGLEGVRLRTGAGIVPVRLCRGPAGALRGEMEQPPPRREPFAQTERLLGALGLARSLLPVELYDNGVRHVHVALGDPAELGALAPDMGALAMLGALAVSCLCVLDGELASASPGRGSGRQAPAEALGGHARARVRVRSRVFAPALGVAEDPATGSAAGPLAWHLARNGVLGFGQWLEVQQGIELGRPSRLFALADGDAEQARRVLVAGAGVLVARGAFTLACDPGGDARSTPTDAGAPRRLLR